MHPLTPDAIRVLICGSRTWNDGGPIQAIIRQYAAVGNAVIIHGAARGADAKADYHARREGLEVVPFPVQWDKYGKRAGYLRNQEMLDVGQPHVVWAFVDKPLAESKGTAMMVDIARTHGVPCYVVESINYG